MNVENMKTNAAKNVEKQDVFPAPPPGHGIVSEMFCSVQGEGPLTGERQVFLRTAGCTETCSWCDTVYSKVRTPRFVIHDPKGKRTLPNPLAVETVVAELLAFSAACGGVDTASITGGEPLEQPEFTGAVARALDDAGLRVYLETAGLHAEAFAQMLNALRVVAMDIKLPSALGHEVWDAHEAFLGVIRGTRFDPTSGNDGFLFVKVVIDPRSTVEEVEHAVSLVAAVSEKIPLVLQPESGVLLSARSPREDAAALMNFACAAQERALRVLDSVRIMPQSHRILGIR